MYTSAIYGASLQSLLHNVNSSNTQHWNALAHIAYNSLLRAMLVRTAVISVRSPVRWHCWPGIRKSILSVKKIWLQQLAVFWGHGLKTG